MRRRKDKWAPTDGARALRSWLLSNGLNIPSFCELHDLDRVQVQRAMNGEMCRASVDFAVSIYHATLGAVGVALWDSHTAVPAAEESAPAVVKDIPAPEESGPSVAPDVLKANAG